MGHHGLTFEFCKTVQKITKIMHFGDARLGGTRTMEKIQVYQDLLTLGDFLD